MHFSKPSVFEPAVSLQSEHTESCEKIGRGLPTSANENGVMSRNGTYEILDDPVANDAEDRLHLSSVSGYDMRAYTQSVQLA